MHFQSISLLVWTVAKTARMDVPRVTQSDKTEEELSAEEGADRERKVIAKRNKHSNPQFLSPSQVGLEARKMGPL